jgi:hypothetical protein
MPIVFASRKNSGGNPVNAGGLAKIAGNFDGKN